MPNKEGCIAVEPGLETSRPTHQHRAEMGCSSCQELKIPSFWFLSIDVHEGSGNYFHVHRQVSYCSGTSTNSLCVLTPSPQWDRAPSSFSAVLHHHPRGTTFRVSSIFLKMQFCLKWGLHAEPRIIYFWTGMYRIALWEIATILNQLINHPVDWKLCLKCVSTKERLFKKGSDTVS